MSYSGHQMNSSGYTPSYSTHNTGADYMARRGWDNTDRHNDSNSISFSGKRTSKRIVIFLIILLCILLLAAVVIIILFATGVISSNAEELVATSTTYRPTFYPPTRPPQPPINPQPTKNSTYACTLTILRQANAAYDVKSSNNFQTAFQRVRNALLTVIYQSTLQPLGVTASLQDLQNRQDDLQVVFTLAFPPTSPIDAHSILNVLRADVTKLQNQLGGNVVIDSNSLTVLKI